MAEISPDAWRLSLFLATLVLLVLLEVLLPRKQRVLTRSQRWPTNISLTLINTICIRLMGPIVAVSIATLAQKNGWGLINHLDLPSFLALFIGIILLDLAIYGQHVATHKIPALWRLHKVHHVDRDIDVTTGFRFHPLEIILSMVYKCGIVVMLGVSPEAVILFEIILSLSSLFNHANIAVPVQLDRYLRLFIVTPDMHRVHHSVHKFETNSNYGFSLSIWDRIFKTYIAQPRDGHREMQIGLSEHQGREPAQLAWSLRLPFKH